MLDLFELLYKPHPWHGLSSGQELPSLVNAYIEIVPTDTVKYEIDKASGYLKVDRPQRYSNLCPTLYGFVPQTYCGKAVGELCAQESGSQSEIVGDGDPLDICVLSERPIANGDIMLAVRPIGGLRMIDGGEADDKIIAVLQNDAVFGSIQDIDDCPNAVLDRLKHYFLTYKEMPDASTQSCVEIAAVYGREVAERVILASRKDYDLKFGNPEERRKLLRAALLK